MMKFPEKIEFGRQVLRRYTTRDNTGTVGSITARHPDTQRKQRAVGLSCRRRISHRQVSRYNSRSVFCAHNKSKKRAETHRRCGADGIEPQY